MKVIKNIVITIIAIVLCAILVTALQEINKHDLSTQKAATCHLKVKGPIYLITYAAGEVYEANAKVLAESALNNCIDIVYMYKPAHLEEDFVQKNKKILDAKRGAGYWLWKPYLIKKTLDVIPEGSIVMYLDSGFKIIEPLDSFINNLVKADIVLVDNYHFTNKEYVKRDLLKLMNMDNEGGTNSKQLSAGMLVVRNTQFTRNFIQKWLAISEIPGVLDETISEEEYPEFQRHSHDQAVLSLLYLQNPEGIIVTPIEDLLSNAWLHKRRSMNKSLYISRSGNKMQMSFWGKRVDEVLAFIREEK